MNRQQKKCLIATVGFHLLLILILVVGPGFFSRPPDHPTTAAHRRASDTPTSAADPAPTRTKTGHARTQLGGKNGAVFQTGTRPNDDGRFAQASRG